MACFAAPAVEAIVVAAASKIIEKKEKETEEIRVSFDGSNVVSAHKIPFSKKLRWLSFIQLGGAILLAFEHIWHGEIVPFFPFLTAASDPVSLNQMLHEIATTGVAMAALTTAVWLVMLGVSAVIEKRAIREAKALSETK